MKNLSDRFNLQVDLMKLTYKIDTRIEPHPVNYSGFNSNDTFSNEIFKYGLEIN